MTWLRLDDKFAGHPKISPLSDGAFRLHVSGLLFCAAHETDGLVPLEQIPLLMPKYRKPYLAEVIARGLWLPRLELIEIHDFTEYNPSRDQLQTRREATKERVARARAARRKQTDDTAT
jgi:hypothetical protein